MKIQFAPIQLLRGETRDDSAAGLTQIIIFQRQYLSSTLVSGTYHIGGANRV